VSFGRGSARPKFLQDTERTLHPRLLVTAKDDDNPRYQPEDGIGSTGAVSEDDTYGRCQAGDGDGVFGKSGQVAERFNSDHASVLRPCSDARNRTNLRPSGHATREHTGVLLERPAANADGATTRRDA
jgi:hypothetical protein